MQRAIGPDEWLEGVHVRLRLVVPSDCTDRYVGWLEDERVNRYLETRWTKQNLDTVTQFVTAMLASSHSYLFAIVLRGTSEHVGNVKIGPVEPRHLYADVSYFLGEPSVWGRGLGTDAVRVATRFGFERLGLHRIQAGFYESNVGSQRVLEKAGFSHEARLVKKLRRSMDSPWEDHVWFGALRDAWLAADHAPRPA